jgi:hypothetical protein
MKGQLITWPLLIGSAVIIILAIVLMQKKLNKLRQSGQTIVKKTPRQLLWLIVYSVIVTAFTSLAYFAFKFILLKIESAFVKFDDMGPTELPDWLSSILTSWWLWLALAILIPLIIFRKKISGKIKVPSVVSNWWSWYKFWLVIGIIALALVIWFEVVPGIGSWGIWKRQHFKSGQSSSKPISDPSSTRGFIFGKENSMRAGVWYTFTQQPGEPLFKFKPATPNTTITYQIVKNEDETRNWSVEVWTDANNKAFPNSLNKDGIEPNDASKVGYSRIKINTNAIVVAYVEEE